MSESLEDAIVNEEIWSCIVVMLVESNEVYEKDIEAFKKLSQKGIRPVIKVISPKELNKVVISNKGDRSVAKSTSNMEPQRGKKKKSGLNKKKIGEGKSLSITSQSNQFGKKVDAEQKLLRVQALQIKKFILNEKYSITVSAEVKEEAEVPHKKRAGKEGSKKKGEEGSKKKGEEGSKKRGKKKEPMIRDEPLCGPTTYFVLTGFYNHLLANELLDMGVPMIAIICYGDKLDSHEIRKNSRSRDGSAHSNSDPTTENKPLGKTKKGKSNQLVEFWLGVQEQFKGPTTYTLITCRQPSVLSSKTARISMIGREKFIFNYLTKALYELSWNIRNYIHFINSANLVSVPTANDTTEPCFPHYKKAMDLLPLEYVTIEYLVHCMVQQVVIAEDRTKIMDENLNEPSANTIVCEPCFINNRNRIQKKFFNVTPSMCDLFQNLYIHMPYCKLISSLPKQETFETSKLKFQLQLLQECLNLDSIDKKKIEIYINYTLLRYLYNTILNSHVPKTRCKYAELNLSIFRHRIKFKKKKEIQNVKYYEDPIIPVVEDPVAARAAQLNKLKFFLECIEMENLKNNFMKEKRKYRYTILQNLNKQEMLQSLQKFYSVYKNVYYLPYPGTDSVLVFFHNDHNKNGLYGDYNNTVIYNLFGFADYYKYVRCDVEKWAHTQGKPIREANWDRRVHTMYLWKKLGLDRSKMLAHPPPNVLPQSNSNDQGFTLYDIEGPIYRNSEKETTFYSVDGVKLNVKIIDWTYHYKYLSFNLSTSDTILNYCYIIEDNNNELNEERVHFNVTTKNGINISCIQKLTQSFDKTLEEIGSNLFSQTKVDYDFNITLPTGLMIEIRHDRDYIKQYYLKGSNVNEEIKNEKYRLYLHNGTIIIFTKKGRVKIMYNNGTHVHINQLIRKLMHSSMLGTSIKRSIDNEKPTGPPAVEKKRKKSIKKKKQNLPTDSVEEDKTWYTYISGDHDVFGWNGVYYKVVSEVVLRKCYRHKLRVANSYNKLIIHKMDGTTTIYEGPSLKVLYPDGTLITTDIGPPAKKRCQIAITQQFIDDLIEEESSTFRRLENSALLYAYAGIFGRTNKSSASAKSEIVVEDDYVLLNAEYNMFHRHYASVGYNINGANWSVTMPGLVEVMAGPKANFIFTNKTHILLEGEKLMVLSLPEEHKDHFTQVLFKLNQKFENEEEDLCQCKDSDGRTFEVNSVGNCLYYMEKNEKNDKYFANEKYQFSSTPKKLYNRFLVMKKDMTGYELIHTSDNTKTLSKFHDMCETELPNTIEEVHTNSLVLDKNLAQSYEMPIINPFDFTKFTKNDLSDYLEKPETWVIDIAPVNYSSLEREYTFQSNRPLAVVYRKFYDITKFCDSCNSCMGEAFENVDLIKEYLHRYFKNNTKYDTPEENYKHKTDGDYKDILHFIGTAKNLKLLSSKKIRKT